MSWETKMKMRRNWFFQPVVHGQNRGGIVKGKLNHSIEKGHRNAPFL